MALNWLIDTSVLTRLGEPEVRAAVEPLAEQGRVGRCTLSDLEVGFSARDANEWDARRHALRVFTAVDVVSADFDQAMDTQRALAAVGLKGRKVPDLIIAAAALRMELSLLHYDRDFDFDRGDHRSTDSVGCGTRHGRLRTVPRPLRLSR